VCKSTKDLKKKCNRGKVRKRSLFNGNSGKKNKKRLSGEKTTCKRKAKHLGEENGIDN